MISAEHLVAAFKSMRAGQGMTLDKLATRPDLRQAFNLDTDSEFIQLIKDNTVDLVVNKDCKAALVSLAIGFAPMDKLESRRLALIGETSLEFGDKLHKLRPMEVKGFNIIALRLLELLEPSSVDSVSITKQFQIQADADARRIDQLLYELSSVRTLLRKTLIDDKSMSMEDIIAETHVLRQLKERIADDTEVILTSLDQESLDSYALEVLDDMDETQVTIDTGQDPAE